MQNSTSLGVLLSGQQLVEHLKQSDDFVLQARGNKLTTLEELPDNTENETNDESLENLRALLGFERIALTNKIVKGVFEPANNRVKVVAFNGKWKVGYFEDCVNYLKPFEALHQIELGRLEVTFDSVVMSVEQAYAIFLDPSNDVSFEEYAVYSYLMRTGYFVYDYSAEADNLRYENLQQRLQKIEIDKENEMIWCVLMEKLNLPSTSKLVESEPELYKTTKDAMTAQIEKIAGKREELNVEMMEVSQGPSQKRHLSPLPEVCHKKLKTNNDAPSEENFLDILKNETEYFTHRHIFERFNFIRRAENFEPGEENNKLKFSFDVFLPSTSFKRSEDLPNYRVIVIKSTEVFPTNIELELLRRQPRYELPIIIAIVSESLTLHFCGLTF